MAFLIASDRFVRRQDAADREEAGLHDGVDAAAHAGLFSHGVAVHHVELQLLFDDLLLDGAREMVPNLVRAVKRIQQERCARPRGPEHVHALEEGELVAGHEARVADEVARMDRLGAEPQVRDSDRAGFLRVVDEIALRVVVRILADDLDGVLVRADRAIRAEAVEQRPDRLRIFGRKRRIEIQAGARDVVVDPDGEMILRRDLAQLVENRLDLRRREVLRGETVAAADDARELLEGRLCRRPSLR